MQRFRSASRGAALAAVLTTITTHAGALTDAGVCADLDIVEVFPGGVGCPDAEYIVIQRTGRVERRWRTWDHCGEYVTGGDLTIAAPDGGSKVIVIGTATLADLTGVTPDVVVDSLGLSRFGGRVQVCDRELVFEMSDLEPGQAIARDPSTRTVSSVAPRARNGSGDEKTFTCDASAFDGGADGGDAAAVSDASSPTPPECAVPVAPMPADAGKAGSDTMAPEAGLETGLREAGSWTVAPDAGAELSGRGGGSTASGGAAMRSWDGGVSDRPGSTTVLNPVTDDEVSAGGCGCTVPGGSRGAGASAAAVLLLLGLARRREGP